MQLEEVHIQQELLQVVVVEVHELEDTQNVSAVRHNRNICQALFLVDRDSYMHMHEEDIHSIQMRMH
jgi:hypothetical protein